MDISVGIEPFSGLEMKREIDFFIGGIKEPIITVWYYQWLRSSNGKRLEEKRMKYIVVDIPAKIESVKITNEQGETVTVQTEVSPAVLGYTSWKKKIITESFLGASLGEDIIIGAIVSKLASLPFNVEDGFVAN